MKKLVLLLLVGMMTSCADVTQMYYSSQYQRQTLSKFGKKRNYLKGSSRYVPARKNGSYRHPAVTTDTYKYVKQF